MFLALLPLAVAAQNPPTFRAEADLVTIPVLVTDAHGTPVRDLKPDEFRLYDNGAPREIRRVWVQDQLPLVIGLVADSSASQHAFLREHQDTVDAFLGRLLRPGDHAFVVTVDENVLLQSEYIGRPFGPSHVLLPRGGEPLREPCPTIKGRHVCSGTILWDGVYATAHSELSRFTGSRALIILSDGNDTGSFHHLDEALAEVRRTGAVVFAIRYPDPLSPEPSHGLSQLVAESGGGEFPPTGDYAAALKRIELELRSQYVLGFYSEAADQSTHTLRVETVRQGVRVRSRTQYSTAKE